ncbi:MAG TPA: hypothetical protein VHC42_03890 [Rhizomicrobium sp.]|nr:hypothetical protein [Rhizomicrobium sp.]
MLKAATIFFAGLMIVVPAVWFALVALSPSYNSCIQNSGQHPTEQYTGDGQQIVEGPIDNPTGFRLALVCGSDFANRNGEAFTGLFTIALTVATFLLGLLAWDQGRTSKAQMRAYVAVEMAATVPPPDEFGLKARIDFKNYGQTPAYSFTVRKRTKTVGALGLDSFDRCLDGMKWHSPINLGSGAITRITIDNILKPEERVSLLMEVCYTMIFGEFKYVDIFDRTWTEPFCLQVRNYGKPDEKIVPWSSDAGW